ncbi:MAG: hypothetical protein JW966_06990 [Anaerolineae bacterium]|nr:hypothetical protein [Anaerolineae bacterium]
MLYQEDAEVLFPARVIAVLRDLRGEQWQVLVSYVITRAEDDPDLLAFSLLMIRLSGCLSCHADSYRAMRGCTQCARHSVLRFKGTDDDLIRLWQSARDEVLRWLSSGEPPLME